MRRRTLVSGLVYVAFLVLFVEVVLQGYYRLTAGAFLFQRSAQPLWAADPHSGFFNRPHLAHVHRTNEFEATYFTDGHGLRVPRMGDEVPRQPGEGRYRILLLGPSFAFGWAVNYEDSFAAELERLLTERDFARGRAVEVVNAGVNSIGIAQALRWLEAEGLQYRPDLILQFVYGSMAVNTNVDADAVVDDEGYLVPRRSSVAQRLRDQLKKSALVFYGWVVYTQTLTARTKGNARVLGAGRPLEMQAGFDPTSETVAASLALFERLRDVAQRAGAELQLVYLPLSYAVHREDEARWRHLGVQDVDAQKAFDAAYCEHLSTQGIRCLDLTPDLVAAAAGGERLYFPIDIHWTPLGNRVAARAVADRLRP
jgi:hypothetical protein